MFFDVAAPVAAVGFVVASFLIKRNAAQPFYPGAEGEARRDAVNEQHGTTRGAVVIALLFVPIYALVVAGMIEQMGARALTFVVAGLLVIPLLAVYGVVTMVYMYTVHGVAALKRRK